MFQGGFDMMVGGLVPELTVVATDDEVRGDKEATTVNPGGGHVASLPTRPCPELDQPFVKTIIGEASLTDLRELARISRIASVHRGGTPVTFGRLEAPLTLGGFDAFEAVMGIRGLNARLPRTS
jgi:hypothetical protein